MGLIRHLAGAAALAALAAALSLCCMSAGAEEMPMAEDLTRAEALPNAEVLTRAEVLPNAEVLSRAEALPNAENLTRAEALPNAEALSRAEKLPMAEDLSRAEVLSNAEALLRAEKLPMAEAQSRADALSNSEAPSIAEVLPNAEAPSLAEALPNAEIPSLAETLPNAEGLRFTLRVSLDTDAYPPSSRALAEALAPLAEASVLSGTLARQGESFDLNLTLTLGEKGNARADVRVYGLPSHWGVTSPLLGDQALMVNHLAWMEFAVKAHNHMELPLRPLFLLSSPYAHTSALAGAGALCSQALGLNGTPRSVSTEALRALAEDLAALPETDRALYYWVEALGMESGADELIFSALEALPDYVAAHFPDGLTLEETETALRWKHRDAVVLALERTGDAQAVSLALPELLEVRADVRSRGGLLAGHVEVACAAVTMDAEFSFPLALPVTEPFALTVDASGPLAGDAGVHLRLAGEPTADGVVVRGYAPEQEQPLWTAEVALAAAEVDCPIYRPEDVAGVNVLSVTGPTLGALLAEVAEPMVRGGFPLLAEAPAVSCQALMDILEARGILPLLLEGIVP